MVLYERKLLSTLIEHLSETEFMIITGARQTGKTTLLDQLADHLKRKNATVYSLTLEDPSILSRLNQHPENLFEFVIRSHGKRVYVLIDEVQYLDNPANFLKLIFDKHHTQVKIIATGSSAFYIDRKFTDSLAGRKCLFELYTLDFDEFLVFRTGSNELKDEMNLIRTNEEYTSLKRHELESYFQEYLTFGGYPAVVLADSLDKKVQKLKELTSSYLKRDISESNIQDHEKFHSLFLLLSQQTGSLVNTNELSKTMKLSVTAIENYLYVLQKCYHIHLLRPFYMNLRKELIKMPKIYFHDLGLRNALLNQFHPIIQRIDKGMVIENYAFIRLRTIVGNELLRYWRTSDGNEIDFIITRGPGSGNAIEIKFDIENFNPLKYRKFRETYPGYSLSCRAFRASGNNNSIIAL
ncbi:MAG: ATP-binding protein [Bacteroidales bacterium]|nr:ATP-binding protein [Lentimicrobiaceae bacterium]MDD5695124.1 ATP-binding protein [Bacteroidales bacterium]